MTSLPLSLSSTSESNSGQTKKTARAKVKNTPTEVSSVLQFQVKLLNTNPMVWRRIQLNNHRSTTFWDLHCAIQNSMGWNDNHVHCFEVMNPSTGKSVRIGKPIEKGDAWSVDESQLQRFLKTPHLLPLLSLAGRPDARNMHASWKAPLEKYYTNALGPYETNYTYDFIDFWIHEVVFEGAYAPEPGRKFPACIGGQCACPPEDCGGILGFNVLLAGLEKKEEDRTEDQKEKIEWLRGPDGQPNFDPEYFHPESVLFVNADDWLIYKKKNTLVAQVRDKVCKHEGIPNPFE